MKVLATCSQNLISAMVVLQTHPTSQHIIVQSGSYNYTTYAQSSCKVHFRVREHLPHTNQEAPFINDKLRTASPHPLLPFGSRLLGYKNGGALVKISRYKEWMAVKDVEGDFIFGVYRSPEQWREVVLKVLFPLDTTPWARPWQADAQVEMFQNCPSGLVQMRFSALKGMIKFVFDHADKETISHDRMPLHLNKITNNKKLLLFEKFLDERRL